MHGQRDRVCRLALVLLVVVAVAAACGSGFEDRAGSKRAGRISVGAASAAAGPVEAADWPGFGFSPGAGLRDQDDARLAGDLAAMVAAGAGWIRIDVDWSLVEAFFPELASLAGCPQDPICTRKGMC